MYRTPTLLIAFRVYLVKARGKSRSIPQTSLSFANAKDIPRSQSNFAPEPAPHLGSSAFDLGRNKEGSRDTVKKLSTKPKKKESKEDGETRGILFN
ncbi:hypothetical protein M9H77_23636 [Catharanthus roseus]|uniref:Uncharacterized protein n=1 Tax=Catharanthus roseus TaxID=4058 RepID=A0ACC0AY01_CATRO|nr:hypothetical protein M9H77_23636 [Catharanthus roseus]